jgi:hypothetical protein
MEDSIIKYNPQVVHLAGHNQYKEEGALRLIGFREGGGLPTEVDPSDLAEMIIGSAVESARAKGQACRLACVIINASDSEKFAEKLLQEATKEGIVNLFVVCWPKRTDDFYCACFASGFYSTYSHMTDAGAGTWVQNCFSAGRRLYERNFTATEIDTSEYEPPKLFGAGEINQGVGEDEDEAAPSQYVRLVRASGGSNILDHPVSDWAIEALRHGGTQVLEDQVSAKEISWEIKFGKDDKLEDQVS